MYGDYPHALAEWILRDNHRVVRVCYLRHMVNVKFSLPFVRSLVSRHVFFVFIVIMDFVVRLLQSKEHRCSTKSKQRRGGIKQSEMLKV